MIRSALIAIAMVVGCSSEPDNTPPDLPKSARPGAPSIGGIEWKITGDRALVIRALEAFVKACPNLTKTSSSFAGGTAGLEDVSVTRDEAGQIMFADYAFEEYGWPKKVAVRLRVSDRPTHFEMAAAQHVLYFDIGSGASPGVSVGPKPWSLRTCAVSSEKGRDGFKPIPELAGVLGDPPTDWKTWRDAVVAQANKKLALPKKRILARRVIGKKRSAARRSIGRALDSSVATMDFFEPKGLHSVDVGYDDDVATTFTVNFVDEVDLTRHVDRREEAAAWVGLPLDDDQCINRRRSKMTISGRTITVTAIGREGSCR